MVILQQYKGQLVIKNWIEVLLIDPCENKQQNQSAQLQTAAGTALLCSIHNHTSAWDSDSSNPGHFAQVLCMSTVSTMEKRTEKGTFWGAAHKTTRSEQRRKKTHLIVTWQDEKNHQCCSTTLQLIHCVVTRPFFTPILLHFISTTQTLHSVSTNQRKQIYTQTSVMMFWTKSLYNHHVT